MAETITVSDNVKVEVGVRFGKYIKIYRGQKSISLSDITWKFVFNNHESLIAKSLENNSEYGLTFTQAKSLRVSMFRDQPYVTFCEDFVAKDGKRLTKYVSLNKAEWKTLQSNLEKIQRILNYDVLYRDDAGDWYLAQVGQDVSNSIEKRLAPRMCAKTFELQLCVYLITSMINKTRKDTCEGCKTMVNLPYWHASDGFGCQADWYTTVHTRLTDVKQMINVEQAINTINLLMGWKAANKGFEFDDQLLCDVTVDHKAMPACDACKELLPIYWDMFENILQ